MRIGAVVFAIALGGAYVWFRAAQAGEGGPGVLPGSKSFKVDVSPSTQPAGNAVAGHPRLVVHDRLPAAEQAIEQGRLADVRPADDRQGRHPAGDAIELFDRLAAFRLAAYTGGWSL